MSLKGAGSSDDTTLVFGVDSSQLSKATSTLSKTAREADQLAKAIEDGRKSSGKLADEVKTIKQMEAFARQKKEAKEFDKQVREAKKSTKKLAAQAARSDKAFKGLAIGMAGASAGVLALGAAAIAAVTAIGDLSVAIFDAAKLGAELATGDAVLAQLGTHANDVRLLGEALNSAVDSQTLGDIQLMGVGYGQASEEIQDLAIVARSASVAFGKDLKSSFEFAAKAALEQKKGLGKLGLDIDLVEAKLVKMGVTLKSGTPKQWARAMAEVSQETIGAALATDSASDSVARVETRVTDFTLSLKQQLFEMIKNEGLLIRIESAMDLLGVALAENEPALRSLAKNGLDVLVTSLEIMAKAMTGVIDLMTKLEKGATGTLNAIKNVGTNLTRIVSGRERRSAAQSLLSDLTGTEDALKGMSEGAIKASGNLARLVQQSKEVGIIEERRIRLEKDRQKALDDATKGTKAGAVAVSQYAKAFRDLEFDLQLAEVAIVQTFNDAPILQATAALNAFIAATNEVPPKFITERKELAGRVAGAFATTGAGGAAGEQIGTSAELTKSTAAMEHWRESLSAGRTEWEAFAASMTDSIDPVSQALLTVADGFEAASIAALSAATPAEGAINAIRAFSTAVIKDKKKLAAFLVPVEIAAAAASYPDFAGMAQHGFAAIKYAIVAGSSAGSAASQTASATSRAAGSSAGRSRTTAPTTRSVATGISGIAATVQHFHVHSLDLRGGAEKLAEIMNGAARSNNGVKFDGRVQSDGRTRRRGF